MTSRRPLALVAFILLAVLGLSGCVAIKTEGSSTRGPGVVTINLSICASQHSAGSPCNPNDRASTAEGDNGTDAASGTPQNPLNGQLVVGFRVPAGTVAPDQFASTAQQQFTKSPGYTSALNARIPPATGFVWVGYISSGVTLTAGAPLTTINPEFGLPPAADGSPFTGPFLWRAIVGAIAAGGDPSSCTAQSCLDSPQPADLATLKQQNISDFRVMPGTGATAAPGQTATLSFTVRYVDNAGFGARQFDLAGSSALPGSPKVTPSAASLTNFLNNQVRTVTASVTVPAGTAPGNYPVTLTATDHASGVVRSNIATLTVVDKTAPAISIGSPTDGQVVQLGQQIAASFSCADEANGSGLASCTGTVANGAALDTATVGPKTFTVTAADKAGNVATLTRTYTVKAPPVPVIRPQINISLSFLFAAGRKTTTFRTLVVKGVPKGATLRTTCKGKKCPKKKFTVKAKKGGSVSLKPYVKKPLRKGLKLTISVTKPGAVGMVKTITIRASKSPKVTTACLPPGAKKAKRCA